MSEQNGQEKSLPEFSDQISMKLILFINNDIRDFWCSIRTNFSQTSEPVKKLAEKLPQIFAESEVNNDLRDKREVYLIIAQFIQKNLHKPLPICLNAVHILLQEKNLSLLEDGAISGDSLIEDVKELIVAITINYEPQDNWMYNRKIEIYFFEKGLRKVHKVPALIDWDKLPSKIREQRMRQQEINIITLYPKET